MLARLGRRSWRHMLLNAPRERMHGTHLRGRRGAGGEQRGKVADLCELPAVRTTPARKLRAACMGYLT